jgi:hypothetical protein
VLLLAHQVAYEGLRPEFPASAPADLVALAHACWQEDPDRRRARRGGGARARNAECAERGRPARALRVRA